MPRTLLTVAAIAALALPVATAHAQVGFGITVGPSHPMGDFGKVADNGFNVNGLLNLSIPLAPIGFRFEGSFNQFNYTGTGLSGNARILSGTANAMISSPGIISPYLIGGVGIYNASAVCTACTTSTNKVGYNGGVGLRFGLGGLSAFAEARYHYIPGSSDATTGGVSSSTQFVPISVGVTF